jgi:hypothetical protein
MSTQWYLKQKRALIDHSLGKCYTQHVGIFGGQFDNSDLVAKVQLKVNLF